MIERRQFLASTASGVFTLATYQLFAAEKLDEFSFVIVSDTHLGRQKSLAPERNWRRAIAEINQGPGDFVLHLGDVVDSGDPQQYPVYAELRKKLSKPIHEIPGNHDPSELFEKHVHTPIDRAFDHAGVRFVLLGNAHVDSHAGFITAKQLEWLEKQFSEAAGKDLRIAIACHVPVHTNSHPDRGWYVQPEDGQKGFYQLVDRHADRILVCLHGHFHNGIRGWRDRGQLVEVLCPSVCYNQSRDLTEQIRLGKAQGFFVDELRPGYILATLGKGRLTLKYKPLGAEVHGDYVADWK